MLLRIVLFLFLLPGIAAAAPWRIDPGTRVAVDVKWSGGTVEVRFPSIAGAIDFDEKRPDRARAAITVATADATTGIPPADLLLRGNGYLDVRRYPGIGFQLDRLVQTSKSTADIHGRISLRGVTRPVLFKANVIRYGPAKDGSGRFEAGFDLTGRIDRREFGSDAGIPDIAAVLPVRIRLLMSSE